MWLKAITMVYVRKRVYRKYSVLDWTNDGFHPDGINQRLIRYADVLLMLAECEAEAGTPADAAKYINEVRARQKCKYATGYTNF